jgi:hypothetical protein
MLIYTYISAIDILWEAITQLHRAIIDRNSKPFDGCNHIFKENRLNYNDNEYFKHIRAVFGAHPVNIDDDVKRFASWSVNHIDDGYDWSVRLYSSVKKSEDIIFGFKYNQIIKFINERINYLDLIIKIRNEKKVEFFDYLKTVPICFEGTILEKIEILKEESIKRCCKEKYYYVLDEISGLYQINSTCKINNMKIKEFKIELYKLVEQIYDNLQNMKNDDIENIVDIREYIPNDLSYDFGKLSENVFSYNYELFSRKKIEAFINKVLTVTEKMSSEELYLLIFVSIFNMRKNERGTTP